MSISEQTPPDAFEHLTRNYKYHEVMLDDPFQTEEGERIMYSLNKLQDMGFYGNANVEDALARKRLSAIDYANPATQQLISLIPGVENWLALVPTARALSPLYNPDMAELPGGYPIGNELRNWLIEIPDARGLRFRDKMEEEILIDRPAKLEPSIEEKWLIVASGTAQAALRASHKVGQLEGRPPHVTIVDLSTEALNDARKLAESLKIDAFLQVERMNVLRRQGLDGRVSLGEIAMHKLFNKQDRARLSREQLLPEQYGVVNAVGILEYMKLEDWAYRYNGVVNLKTTQAGAKTFLRNINRLVKPGGDLIVGNMLDTHPKLGFTLNTIQWPHIQPRSIDQMMELFDAAGLGSERDVYVSADEQNRAYALYRVRKPETMAG